jgi:hypothetical protein
MEERKLEILELKKSIKRKHRELTLGGIESTQLLERQFKPITDPLNKILEEKETMKKTKEETAEDYFLQKDDYEMIDPFANISKKRKNEDDFTPNKRSFDYSQNNQPMEEDEPLAGDELDILPIEGRKSPLTPKRELESDTTMESILKTKDGKRRAIIAMKSLSNEWLQQAGELPRNYLLGFIEDVKKEYDYTYGMRFLGNELMMGNCFVSFDENNIVLTKEKREYDPLIEQLGLMKIVPGTKGIFELIFKIEPTDYTDEDYEIYKEVLQFTSSHRAFDSSSGNIKSNRGKKYHNIIKNLFPPKGKGLDQVLTEKVSYIYYNNPNELCDRLKLLVSSQRAGHTGHTNEINSIIEELAEAGLIVRSTPRI